MNRTMALLAFLYSSSIGAANAGDHPINSASELRDWCKEASEQALIAKGLSPFNWTASYSDSGSILTVKGQWRVDSSAVGVECHTARGDAARSATMTLHEGDAGGS